MTTARYQARRLPKDQVHGGFYGIRDTVAKVWTDKWGRPDADYYAASPAVARMRARDLRRMTGGR